MSWLPEVEEINRRRSLARQMGGPESVERKHQQGALTIRERIDALLDEGSFRELGPIAGSADYDDDHQLSSFTPANSLLGTGRVDGREVVVRGEDMTIRGGSSDGGGRSKAYYSEHLARSLRLPLIGLHEGAGGSITSNRKRQGGNERGISGHLLSPYADLLATVPVATAALGSCAGIVGARVVYSHFSVMIKERSFIFAGGPPVVERALGRFIPKEELGSWRIHAFNGTVDNVADDEQGCFDQIRAFLSYLPSNVWELTPRATPEDDPDRRDELLLEIIPRERRRAFSPRKLIECVVDRGSFFELTPFFGRSLMTGLARVDGYAVGVMSNNPNANGGAMDGQASEKIVRFVDLCDTFHLPIVSFEDEPGFMVGLDAERAATLRKGVRALAAVHQSTVPWIKFIVRRAYGVAAGAHHTGSGPVYAWPSGEWGSLPVEGGVWAAHRREIEAAPDPEARRQELEQEYEKIRTPFGRAEGFGLHDLIDPRESRPLTVEFVRRAQANLRTMVGPKQRPIRP